MKFVGVNTIPDEMMLDSMCLILGWNIGFSNNLMAPWLPQRILIGCFGFNTWSLVNSLQSQTPSFVQLKRVTYSTSVDDTLEEICIYNDKI